MRSSPSLRAPLQPLPVPAECWESVSMNFVFKFPAESYKNTGILVFVDRFSKMVHLVAIPESTNASSCASVFIYTVFRLHGLPREIVFVRNPRFTYEFWQSVFKTLETRIRCPRLTIRFRMVRPNVPIVPSRRSFKDRSTPLRIGANSCRWWSSPSEI